MPLLDNALRMAPPARGVRCRCTSRGSIPLSFPGGVVYPCRRLPIPIGNLRETPLWELYAGSPLLRRLRDG